MVLSPDTAWSPEETQVERSTRLVPTVLCCSGLPLVIRMYYQQAYIS